MRKLLLLLLLNVVFSTKLCITQRCRLCWFWPRVQEWYVSEVTAKRNEKIYACCSEPYPDVTFTIHMQRRSLFYVVNLISPCPLILSQHIVLPQCLSFQLVSPLTCMYLLISFSQSHLTLFAHLSSVYLKLPLHFTLSACLFAAADLTGSSYTYSQSHLTLPSHLRCVVSRFLSSHRVW